MDSKTVYAIGAVALIAYILIKKDVEKVAEAIDPTSQDNIFYTGVNKVGAILTQNDGFDLGTWTYDLINSKPEYTPIYQDRLDNLYSYY